MPEEELQTAKETEEAGLLKEQEDDKQPLSVEDYEKKIAELEAQKDKRKTRFQRNAKKNDVREQPNQSTEEIVKSVLQKEREKDLLLNTYSDAKDKMDKIEEIKQSKNLSMEEAYKLIKFDEIKSGTQSYGVHGEFSKPPQGPVDEVEKLLQTPNTNTGSVWNTLKK